MTVLSFENTHAFRLKALSDKKTLHAVVVAYEH